MPSHLCTNQSWVQLVVGSCPFYNCYDSLTSVLTTFTSVQLCLPLTGICVILHSISIPLLLLGAKPNADKPPAPASCPHCFKHWNVVLSRQICQDVWALPSFAWDLAAGVFSLYFPVPNFGFISSRPPFLYMMVSGPNCLLDKIYVLHSSLCDFWNDLEGEKEATPFSVCHFKSEIKD